MSLLKKAFKAVGSIAKKVAPMIPGPIGTIAKVAGVGSVGLGAVKALPALPKIAAGLPAVVRSAPGIGKIGRAVGAAATGAAVYDAAGNFLGTRKRRRRINPLNHRALNRALKRVEKAKKAMKRVNAITIRKTCSE